jgi:1-acyl-sn-glycerol-3-phosphate acyltransferase
MPTPRTFQKALYRETIGTGSQVNLLQILTQILTASPSLTTRLNRRYFRSVGRFWVLLVLGVVMALESFMTQLISEQNNASSSAPQSTSQIPPIQPQIQPQDVSVKSMSSQVSSWLVPLVYAVGRYLVLPIYFRKVEVVGQEWLPRSGPIILAPTHRSRWDALMLPYATGRRVTGRDLRFMVTQDEVKGIQGWFIRRLGGFSVDTRRPGVASLRHGIELLQQGEMMVIFPEGNIFRERSVQPLKAGFARLALQATAQDDLNVQVVPVSLAYSDRLVPWRSTIQIRIGPPLSVQSYRTGQPKQDAKALTTDLHQSLQTLLTDSCQALNLSQP